MQGRQPANPHRTYPPPADPWVMRMVWHDLLFMHWPVDAAALRPHVPADLAIDTYTGGPWHEQAWLAVVPFWMSGVRARWLPPVPSASRFPELNVRTYVLAGRDDKRRPGVYFFSLDAASRLAVAAARATFHLKYMNASMAVQHTADPAGQGRWIDYRSTRTHRAEPAAAFRGRYRPLGPAFDAPPGSVESFITDRYCLYSADSRGRVWRGEIDHAPWPLRPAQAEVSMNTMASPLGISLPPIEAASPGLPLLHYADRMDVLAWWPQRVDAVQVGRVRGR